VRSRRLEYSESTRDALVDSAVALFTERGYAATSLDEVAKQARVTKGALYHHFAGKQALFEAVFDRVETTTMSRLAQIVGTPERAVWDSVMEGLRQYMKVCLEPSYQRIVIHEGPVVMGWERWRECEDRYSFGIVRSAVGVLIDSGEIEDMPVETTSRLLFGALWAGATLIAGSADPHKTSNEVFDTVVRLLEGHRRLESPSPAAG
jgi:AcrR family transcriptional regulator